MCFSAMVEEDYRSYVHRTGASIELVDFMRLFQIRMSVAGDEDAPQVLVAKAMAKAFLDTKSSEPEILAIQDAIRGHDVRARAGLEAEITKQEKRLADNERKLALKVTKTAQEEVRKATAQIARRRAQIAAMAREDLRPSDSRIYPGWFAPVLIVENGQRVVRPMRYRCRPAGKPEVNDERFPGTYNARMDSLGGYWKGVFGHAHGVVLASAFYENVARHAAEGRELAPGEKESSVTIEFKPNTGEELYLACLWSRWGEGDEALLSFAAITTDPPPEVRAAGHDRCIVPIRPEHLDAWLNPNPDDLAAQYAILEDRVRPYFQHKLAA